MGSSALMPEIAAITDTTVDKGVFVLLSQASNNYPINLFATMNTQSLDCKISLETHARTHAGCIRDASACCDPVQAVLQHHRNIQGNVCWLLFERMCREK